MGRQESWLSRVQLHSTDLHHGLKTVGSLFKNAFLTRVHSCSQIFDSCSLVFVIFDSCSLVFVSFWLVFTRVHKFLTRVHSCSLVFINFWLVFTRVRQFLTRVHSCSQIFDSCSLVFTRVHKFLTRVHSCSLVLSRVHSCSDSCGLLEQIN